MARPIDECPVCKGTREEVFKAKLLGRHCVAYCYCPTCGLLQTERPYWLAEAYRSAIAVTDVDLVARNLLNLRRIGTLLHYLGPTGRHCDVAGGYGLLVRLLRDIGIDAYWDDPHCTNVFAQGYEAENVPGPFASVSAMEVLEHLHDPVAFLAGVLERWRPTCLFLSTQLFEGDPPTPGRWSYYAPETGQHITFFQRRTLQALASRFGLYSFSQGSFHVLTAERRAGWLQALLSGRATHLLSLLVRAARPSLTLADAARAEERARTADRVAASVREEAQEHANR